MAVAVAVAEAEAVVVIVVAVEVFLIISPTEHSVQLSRPAGAHGVTCCCGEETCSVSHGGGGGGSSSSSSSSSREVGGGAHLHTHSVHCLLLLLRSTDIHIHSGRFGSQLQRSIHVARLLSCDLQID